MTVLCQWPLDPRFQPTVAGVGKLGHEIECDVLFIQNMYFLSIIKFFLIISYNCVFGFK